MQWILDFILNQRSLSSSSSAALPAPVLASSSMLLPAVETIAVATPTSQCAPENIEEAVPKAEIIVKLTPTAAAPVCASPPSGVEASSAAPVCASLPQESSPTEHSSGSSFPSLQWHILLQSGTVTIFRLVPRGSIYPRPNLFNSFFLCYFTDHYCRGRPFCFPSALFIRWLTYFRGYLVTTVDRNPVYLVLLAKEITVKSVHNLYLMALVNQLLWPFKVANWIKLHLAWISWLRGSREIFKSHPHLMINLAQAHFYIPYQPGGRLQLNFSLAHSDWPARECDGVVLQVSGALADRRELQATGWPAERSCVCTWRSSKSSWIYTERSTIWIAAADICLVRDDVSWLVKLNHRRLYGFQRMNCRWKDLQVNQN